MSHGCKCKCKYPHWEQYGSGTRMCIHCGATQYATWIDGRGTVYLAQEKDAPQEANGRPGRTAGNNRMPKCG